MKFQARLVVSSIFIFIVPIFFLGIYFYAMSVKFLEHQTVEHIDSLASVYKSHFNHTFDDFYYNINFIVADDDFLQKIRSYNETGDELIHDELNEKLDAYKLPLHSVTRISVLDSTGLVIASTDHDKVEQNFSDFGNYNESSNEDINIDYYANDSGEKSVIFSGPLLSSGENLGVYYIEYDANSILRFDDNYPGLGKTGEVIIATRDERGNANIISPTRFETDESYQTVINKDDQESPMIKALNKKEGVYAKQAIDYRGKRVFAATRYLDIVDWGMVVKIDRDELRDRIIRLRIVYVSIVVGVAILVFFLMNYLSLTMTDEFESEHRSRKRR